VRCAASRNRPLAAKGAFFAVSLALTPTQVRVISGFNGNWGFSISIGIATQLMLPLRDLPRLRSFLLVHVCDV
jgi:hypothetical protein